MDDPGGTISRADGGKRLGSLGDLDGASVISLYGGYHFTRNLSTELHGREISGDFSSGWLAALTSCTRRFPSGGCRRTRRSAPA